MEATALRRTATMLGAALLAMTSSVPALAGECNIACSPSTNCGCVDSWPSDGQCIITTQQVITGQGAVIDCGQQNIVLRARLWMQNVSATLRAGNLTIEGNNRIEATQASAGVPFGMTIELGGALDMTGVLEARSDGGGGVIRVRAAGNILVRDTGGGDGALANATGPGGHGGRIELVSGGVVTLHDPVMADGAHLGNTKGGQILVEAVGSVTIRTKLSAFGHQVSGGTIRLNSQTGAIDIQPCTGCFVKAEGGEMNGDGGGIFVRANTLTVGALLSAQGGYGLGGGGQSAGGTVYLEAGPGGIAVNADVNVTGGEGGAGLDGGAIVAESEGPITVAGGVHLVTKSDGNGGDGGDIRMTALDRLTINGNAVLDARGDWGGSDEGTGASVELEACDLTLGSGASIDARGFNGGAVTLTGRERLTVGGTVNVTAIGGDAGSVRLAYRLPGACATSPTAGCVPPWCRPGVCSNDPTRQCTVNANCTIGCQTGTCARTCAHDVAVPCTVDTDCQPCGAAQCVVNPDTTGAQFVGAAPELDEDRSLESCD